MANIHKNIPTNADTSYQRSKKTCSNCKVPEISLKELRHLNVSFLINELEAKLLTVRKRLEHSGIQINLGMYSLLYPTIDQDVAD